VGFLMTPSRKALSSMLASSARTSSLSLPISSKSAFNEIAKRIGTPGAAR
jgi:hypothetical protein